MMIEARDLLRMSDEELVASGELNNFIKWLPRGESDCFYLEDYIVQGMADIKFVDCENPHYMDDHSEVWMGLTPRKYAKYILRLIDEAEIGRSEIGRIIDEWHEIGQLYNSNPLSVVGSPDVAAARELLMARESLQNKLYLMVMPVVRRLLRQGFRIYDLGA